MVAGGGGGSSYGMGGTIGFNDSSNLTFGVGGGLFGGNGTPHSHTAYGGTQTGSGGGSGSWSDGGFGFGGNGVSNYHPGGGGGGGYYGGSAAHGTSGVGAGGGGGGSSFVSGHAGCVAISSETDRTPRVGCETGTDDVNCSLHYSGIVFTNTVMIDGAGRNWSNVVETEQAMPSPDGSFYGLGEGHVSNGFGRISLLKE